MSMDGVLVSLDSSLGTVAWHFGIVTEGQDLKGI